MYAFEEICCAKTAFLRKWESTVSKHEYIMHGGR